MAGTRNRSCALNLERLPASLLVMIFSVLTAMLSGSQIAAAQSHRCPKDRIEALGDAQPTEVSKIESLWKDLHGPGASGGDGPLGCPVGKAQKVEGGLSEWTGVQQKFQRGWVLLGRGAWIDSEIAVIRGLANWTIWSKGLGNLILPTVPGVQTKDFTAAAWARGGSVFVTPSTDKISLLSCTRPWTYPTAPGALYGAYANEGCLFFTPVLDATGPGRPFDAAAHLPFIDAAGHLDLHLLTTPDVDGFDQRVNALFADWLPCHVPTLDNTGEATFAHAMIMMRRVAPCPLTGRSPSGDVRNWLMTLSYPADQLPGTSNEGFPCPTREGELDVTLAQTLRLALKYRAELNGPVFEHIKSVLNPWGVVARITPYVTPNGNCLGFGLIETENHMLLQETSAYLINSLMGRGTQSNRDWILKFLDQISRRDFYEFNAIPYSRYQLKALYLLYDFAPDEQVKIVAKGVLDWIFAKQAVGGNLDRDHRPFRRSLDDQYWIPSDWWGSAATPITTETALFAGPLQHAHSDIDLQFNNGLDEALKPALTSVEEYPKLGAAPEYSTESLVDAASTGYRFPEAIVGWLQRRFTSEESNRTTYLQAINHPSKASDDLAIFAQARSGTELVSGNRNWTMIGGGTPAPPGDPGPPPETGLAEGATTVGGAAGGAIAGAYAGAAAGPVGAGVGAVIGGVVGGILGNKKPKDIAADKQHEKLWATQAGRIRETTLIPTPVGLDREQTIRFGRTIVVAEGGGQTARLCVAEGFMCGFDLRMPTRPFPAKDALNCPVNVVIPPALTSAFQVRVGVGQTITSVLGCPTKKEGFLQDGSWTLWTFDNGMLALGLSDLAGQERFAGAWIEGRTDKDRGRLRVAWDIRGDGYNWFRVHAYEKSITPQGGEPPGGWIDPLLVIGDAGNRTKFSDGDTSFKIPDTDPDVAAPSWDILIVGCKKKYFAGVLTGHNCVDNKMPRLTAHIGPLPKQSFSCAVHPPPPPSPAFQAPTAEGVVLEVGSCNDGPYGLFVYIWSKPCPPTPSLSVSSGPNRVCPEGASDYGFVVAAPSRGLKPVEFWSIVQSSMGSQVYAPGFVASIDVPISPPVTRGTTGWVPTASPSKHTVTFNWPVVDGAAIQGDTGAPGFFGATALGAPPKDWPTALGHVSTPGIAGASNALMRNSGSGCFTVAGFPTPFDPDPVGLLVDFRNLTVPVVADRRTSDLAALCP